MNISQTACAKADWGALFDLDGVLIDSEDNYTMFWHDIDRKYPTGVERFEYVIKGSTLQSILHKYFVGDEIREKILHELKAHEKNMIYRLFDGVEIFLDKLKELGVLSAIVTSSNAVKMNHLFRQLPRLKELVEIVITEEDVSRSKPDPEGYNIAASRLGLHPKRCIVFEDSMAGVEAGRRAGGAVVGVATTNTVDSLMEFADLVVNSISEIDVTSLPQLLEKYME